MGVVVNPFAYALGGGQGVSYVEVTIAASEVSSTLTDFPVYVDLSDLPAAFFTNVQSDGGDIRVTESDGTTRCPVELVAIDTGASTGELHFLASSISSSSDTTFRIYYDASTTQSQPGVATTYGRNAVWAAYNIVLHLNEDPAGTSPQFVDSTGNGYDATNNGSTQTTGALGNALSFDGVNDYVDVDVYPGVSGSGNRTTQSWFKTTVSGSSYWWSYGQNATGNAWRVRHDSGTYPGQPRIELAGSFLIGGSTTNDGTWHALSVVLNGDSMADVDLYVDGSVETRVSEGTDIAVDTDTTAYGLLLADDYSSALAGPSGDVATVDLDEWRERPDALTAAWLASEYTNQNTPTTFYTIGSEQAA